MLPPSRLASRTPQASFRGVWAPPTDRTQQALARFAASFEEPGREGARAERGDPAPSSGRGLGAVGRELERAAERVAGRGERGSMDSACVLLDLGDGVLTRAVEDDLARDGVRTVRVDDERGLVRSLAGNEVGAAVVQLDDPGRIGRAGRLLEHRARIHLVAVLDCDDEAARVEALRLGFDDAVCTPVSGRELAARLLARLRRAVDGAAVNGASSLRAALDGTPVGGSSGARRAGPADGVPLVGSRPDRVEVEDGLTVDLGRLVVERGERTVDLTPLEAGILAFLIRNDDRVVSREEIVDVVWGDRDSRACQRTVDVHVVALRRKLHGGTGSQRLIRTVRGLGYRWCG